MLLLLLLLLLLLPLSSKVIGAHGVCGCG